MSSNPEQVTIIPLINLGNVPSSLANATISTHNYITSVANAVNNVANEIDHTSNILLTAVQIPGSTGAAIESGLGVTDVLQVRKTIVCENYVGDPSDQQSSITVVNNQDIYLGWVGNDPQSCVGVSGPTGYVGNINLSTINGLPFSSVATTTDVEELKNRIDALYNYFFRQNAIPQ
jgi:hypothetical protein